MVERTGELGSGACGPRGHRWTGVRHFTSPVWDSPEPSWRICFGNSGNDSFVKVPLSDCGRLNFLFPLGIINFRDKRCCSPQGGWQVKNGGGGLAGWSCQFSASSIGGRVVPVVRVAVFLDRETVSDSRAGLSRTWL
ncbi:protein of unknown function [Kyrpidia spormannii]|uniref:Uncharacterized protein n=1 Tax=Kyrpidia spormannii TaxID=2055160 RepID=A0A6F9EII0_9BACL|nr:protein of unknown function [Kyrpidia spormannii]